MTGPVSLPAVPWNAAWTGENMVFEVRRCRFAQNGLALWQPHNPGVGKPMFAEPHVVRQRRSIAEMRCTVCGEQTPAGDRFWFEHGTEHEGWFMTTESPVHHACALHAMQVCPHIRKRGLQPYPFPIGATVLAATIKAESLLSIFGLTANEPVVGMLKLAFPLSRVRRFNDGQA